MQIAMELASFAAPPVHGSSTAPYVADQRWWLHGRHRIGSLIEKYDRTPRWDEPPDGKPPHHGCKHDWPEAEDIPKAEHGPAVLYHALRTMVTCRPRPS